MKIKNKLTLVTLLVSLPALIIAAAVLRTSTGFYYPADKTHQNSIYDGFNAKNPFFGNRCHLANDYNLAIGSPVYATGSGVVAQASTSLPFYGSDTGVVGGAMIIKHTTADDKTFYALYGHINNFTVAVGDTVSGGQKIAEVANYTSGGNPLSHLHFGINTNNASYQGFTPTSACSNNLGFVEPENYITTNSAKLLPAETCTAVSDTAETTENTILTIPNVLSNDTDVDTADTLSISSADANSANGEAIGNNGDGTFVYTPAIDFVGSDSFNYSITDNNGCTSQATVTITVNADGTITNSGGGSFSLKVLIGFLSLVLLQIFVKYRRCKSKSIPIKNK